MLDINKARKLTDLNKIDEQINIRRNLGRQMVGQLYPSILFDEIRELEYLKYDLKHKGG